MDDKAGKRDDVKDQALNLLNQIVIASREIHKLEPKISKIDVISPVIFGLCINLVQMNARIEKLEKKLND